MTKRLQGKIAVITGGSAGIGLGAAKRFVEEGAQVFITGRRRSELDRAVAETGGNVTPIEADASSLADIDRVCSIVKDCASRIDVLFANAGMDELAAFGEITPEHFDQTFDTNVRGLFFTVKKALPLLFAGSSVILTGSIASTRRFPSLTVYEASKAAVRSFARGWSADLKGRDIRVNMLSAGLMVSADEQICAAMMENVPLEGAGRSDYFARAAVFLASDDSSDITGIEFFVDGGIASF